MLKRLQSIPPVPMMAAAAVDINEKVISMNLDIMEEQRGHMHHALDDYVDEVIDAGRQWTTSTDRNRPTFLEIYKSISNAITFLCLKCDEMKHEQLSCLNREASHLVWNDEFTHQQKHSLMDSGVHNNSYFLATTSVTTHGDGKEDDTYDVRNTHTSRKPNLERDQQTRYPDHYNQLKNILGKQDGVDRELNRKLDSLRGEVESLKSNVGAVNQNVKSGNTFMGDCSQKVEFLELVVSCLSEKVDGINTDLSDKVDGINTVLSAHIVQVQVDLSEKVDQLDTNLSDKVDHIKSDLSDKVDHINTYLSDRADHIKSELSEKVDTFNTDMSDKVEHIKTDLSDKVDHINTDLSEKVDKVNTDLSDKVDKINTDLSDNVDGINTDLSAHIVQVQTDLSDKIDHLNTDLLDKIDHINTDMLDKVDHINTDLSDKVDKINTDLSDKVDDINTDLSEHIVQVQTDLSDKVHQLNTDLSDKVDHINADMSAKVDQINTDLSEKCDQMNTDLSDRVYKIYGELSATVDQVKEMLESLSNCGKEHTAHITKIIDLENRCYTMEKEAQNNVKQVQQQLDEVGTNYTVIRELLVKRLEPLETLRNILNDRATKQNENVRQLRAVMKTMTDLSHRIATGVRKRDVEVSGFNAKSNLSTSAAAFSIVGSFDPPIVIAECQFNSTTGIFTASLDGMYLAYISVYLYTDGKVGFYLIHREKSPKVSSPGFHHQIGWAQAENKGSSACNIGMIQLKAGDDLFIRMSDGCCANRLIQFSCFRIGS